MAFSAAEETRIQAIETMLNSLQIAVSNLASKQQLRQLTLLKQNEIEALETRITALETIVATLQAAL